MQELNLLLPWPPSTNDLYSAYRGRKVLKQAHRAYRIRVKRILQNIKKINGNVYVYYALFSKDRRKRDIDNFEKGLFDALKNTVIGDDSRIISVEKHMIPSTCSPKGLRGKLHVIIRKAEIYHHAIALAPYQISIHDNFKEKTQ